MYKQLMVCMLCLHSRAACHRVLCTMLYHGAPWCTMLYRGVPCCTMLVSSVVSHAAMHLSACQLKRKEKSTSSGVMTGASVPRSSPRPCRLHMHASSALWHALSAAPDVLTHAASLFQSPQKRIHMLSVLVSSKRPPCVL